MVQQWLGVFVIPMLYNHVVKSSSIDPFKFSFWKRARTAARHLANFNLNNLI